MYCVLVVGYNKDDLQKLMTHPFKIYIKKSGAFNEIIIARCFFKQSD